MDIAQDQAPGRLARAHTPERRALAAARRVTRQAYTSWAAARTERVLADARAHLRIQRDATSNGDKAAVALALRWAVERALVAERTGQATRADGTLSGLMSAAWVASLEQAIRGELATLGVSRDVTLTDEQVRAEVRRQTDARASGVMQTLAGDTRSWLDDLPDDTDAEQALADYADWLHERDAAKAGVVALAETQAGFLFGQRTFVRRNGLEGEARCVPDSAVCDVCADYVSAGWVTLDEAMTWNLPAHPKCPHEIETRYDDGTDTEGLWDG